MSYVLIYGLIGLAFGTYMWLGVGRHMPVNPDMPKHVTLTLIMAFWPLAIAAQLVFLWREMRR